MLVDSESRIEACIDSKLVVEEDAEFPPRESVLHW
jgi:hypothetical protein